MMVLSSFLLHTIMGPAYTFVDKFCTTCIMSADNLPRLGLESVDSFNCEHGEGFYFTLLFIDYCKSNYCRTLYFPAITLHEKG